MKRFIVILLVLSLLSVPAFALDISDFERIYNTNAESFNAPEIIENQDVYTTDNAYYFKTDGAVYVGFMTDDGTTANVVFVIFGSEEKIGEFFSSCAAVAVSLMENTDQLPGFYSELMHQYLMVRIGSETKISKVDDYSFQVTNSDQGYQMILIKNKFPLGLTK